MPNFIQNIPNISISQGQTVFDAGKFNNAFIRSLNMDFGINENPTSLNVGLIEKDGNYDPLPELSYLSPYNLKIGNDLNFVCYLKSQKSNVSSNEKSLELEFVDGSHILDRVYVGLIGTHTIDSKFLTSPEGEIDESAVIPLSCPPCFDNNLISPPNAQGTQIVNAVSRNIPISERPPSSLGVHEIFIQRRLREANLGKCFVGDTVNGGYIFLGKEKFTKTSCDLPAVDYSFEELKEACRNFGGGIDIQIKDKSFINNQSFVRRAFQGTLRKVLNDWCALFGVSFYFDFTNIKPTVKHIDLSNAAKTATMQDIAAAAKLIKAGDNALIESISENKSLDGTYKKNLITSYKRKRTLRSYDKTTYYGTAYKAFRTTDLLTEKFRSFRSEEQFNISCYLAKYNSNIRTLYNTWLAGNELASSGSSKKYGCLGLEFGAHISPQLRKEIIDECLDTDTYNDIISKLTVPVQIPDVDMFIALYSPDLAKKHLEFEKNWAENVMGKYFYTNLNTFADEKYGGYQVCYTGADWRYKVESSITPNPEDVSNSNKEAGDSDQTLGFVTQRLPFSKYLWGPIPINPWGVNAADPRLKIYERNSCPWSLTQEEADDYFTTKSVNGTKDLAEPFLPRFQKITGMIETRLRARFKGTAFDVNNFLDVVKKDSEPVLVIAPKPARIGQILNVGGASLYGVGQGMITVPNYKESPYWNSKGTANQNTPDCSKSLACEIQESLEQEVCKPENLCPYPSLSPTAADPTTAFGKIYAARDNEPFPEGVANLLGGGVSILFRPPIAVGQAVGPARPPIHIVGPAGTAIKVNPASPATVPLNNLYLANYKEHVTSEYYQDKVEQFLGDNELNTVGNVSEVQLELNNLDTDSPIFNSKDAQGNIVTITNVYIQGEGFLTIEDYHKKLKNNIEITGSDSLKHTVSVQFGSLDYGSLSTFLNAGKGLTSFSVKIDQGGASASANWTNRPAKAPSPDLFTQQIEPMLLSRNILRS